MALVSKSVYIYIHIYIYIYIYIQNPKFLYDPNCFLMIWSFGDPRDPIVFHRTFERSLGHLREPWWSPGIIGTRGISRGFVGFPGIANKSERQAWNLFRHQRKSLRLRSVRRWFIFREYAIWNMLCGLFDFAFTVVCDQIKNRLTCLLDCFWI